MTDLPDPRLGASLTIGADAAICVAGAGVTPRLPWLLPARHRPDTHDQEATATRYPDPGDPHTGPPWIHAEAAVLHRLADHGGDLQAHRTVHLEDR